MSEVPEYMNATYYARFHMAGWHAVRRWGDYIDIRLWYGRSVSVWDDSAAEVTGKPPSGLCRKCAARMTRQSEMML